MTRGHYVAGAKAVNLVAVPREPEYRPFTADELVPLIGGTIWRRLNAKECGSGVLHHVGSGGVFIGGWQNVGEFERLFREWEYAPVGSKPDSDEWVRARAIKEA